MVMRFPVGEDASGVGCIGEIAHEVGAWLVSLVWVEVVAEGVGEGYWFGVSDGYHVLVWLVCGLCVVICLEAGWAARLVLHWWVVKVLLG